MREPGVEPTEQQNARIYNQPAFFMYKPPKKPPTVESPVSIQLLAPEGTVNVAFGFIRKTSWTLFTTAKPAQLLEEKTHLDQL